MSFESTFVVRIRRTLDMTEDTQASSVSYWEILKEWGVSVLGGLAFLLGVAVFVAVVLAPVTPLIVWYVFGFEFAVVWALTVLCLLVFAQNVEYSE